MKGRRRVERHVLMTVLSTLLPMILFGYVFYAATVEQTLSQADRRLRDHSKTYALSRTGGNRCPVSLVDCGFRRKDRSSGGSDHTQR